MKIAIISFFHSESSICLAKYLAKPDCLVDYYYITDLINDKGNKTMAFEYVKARKRIGLIELCESEAPEAFSFFENKFAKLFLIRIIGFSPKLNFCSKLILKLCMKRIKKRNYDAINIVGQHPLVNTIHNELFGQNIIHTLHEVTIHDESIINSSKNKLVYNILKHKSKVILHSEESLKRLSKLSNFISAKARFIPFGKFESYLLYDKNLNIKFKFKSDYVFLFYGFFKPYKGLDILKEAIELLNLKKIKFDVIIAGNGFDQNLLKLKEFKNVHLINRYLLNEEIIALNKMANCILCPYKSASQSGIVSTTFMFNKPIIATSVGGFVETIINNKNGLLIAPNAIELQHAMEKLVTNQFVYDKLVEGVEKFGKNDIYDWNNISHQTLNFFLK
jgi:glycosyltransferase involved in cell wall biosynthesis